MKSPMSRRGFLASAAAGIAGSLLVPRKGEAVVIRRINGYTISNEFDSAERSLLRDSLAIFYSRFLNVRLGEDKRAGCIHSRMDMSDYKDLSPRGVFECQMTHMRSHIVLGGAFPHVQIDYGDRDNNFVGWADTGIMRVKRYEGADESPFDGVFRVTLNDKFVNTGRLGEAYVRPDYWAGVIAHEILHNLGHSHPEDYNASDYHLYQLVLHEIAVMRPDSAYYGERQRTPVLCGCHWSNR